MSQITKTEEEQTTNSLIKFSDKNFNVESVILNLRVLSDLSTTLPSSVIDVTLFYTINIDTDRLAKQAAAFAECFSRIPIDKIKFLDVRINTPLARKIFFGKLYIYLNSQAYKYGYYSNTLMLNERIYLFPGLVALMNAMMEGNFYTSDDGDVVSRRLTIPRAQHRLNLIRLNKSFPWLNINPGASNPDDVIPFNNELHSIAERTKLLAKDNKTSLPFWLIELNNINDVKTHGTNCGYLGNVCFKQGFEDTILIPPTSFKMDNFSLTDQAVAINPAVFITLIEEDTLVNGSTLQNSSVYNEYRWNGSRNMIQHEVKAVTGMDCGMYREDRSLINGLGSWGPVNPPRNFGASTPPSSGDGDGSSGGNADGTEPGSDGDAGEDGN